METSKKAGVVTSFNRETGYGVFVVEGRWQEFHCTYFHVRGKGASVARARWPRAGEEIEVVYGERGQVVEVRAQG